MELVYDANLYAVWQHRRTKEYFAISISESHALHAVASSDDLADGTRVIETYRFVPAGESKIKLVLDTAQMVETEARILAEYLVPTFVKLRDF